MGVPPFWETTISISSRGPHPSWQPRRPPLVGISLQPHSLAPADYGGPHCFFVRAEHNEDDAGFVAQLKGFAEEICLVNGSQG